MGCIKCVNCNKDLPEYGCEPTNEDGDMVCSPECHKKYIVTRAREMDFIANASPTAVEKWLTGGYKLV